MRIVVKTVTKQEVEINIEDEKTVGDLKDIIDADHGYAKEGMKLVYKGKMLEDASTLKDAGLADNESCIMVAKKRANVPEKKETPTPTPAPTPAVASTEGAQATPAPAAVVPEATQATATPTPAPAQPEAPATTTPAQATPTPAPAQPAAGGSDSFFATGDSLSSAVAQIVEITGCDAAMAQRALRAAFNNPDRAVEYIFNGSIPNIDAPPAGGPPAGGQQQQQTGGGGAPQTPGADDMDEEGDEGEDDEAQLQQFMAAAQAQGMTPEQMMATLQQLMAQGGGGGRNESQLVQALRSVPQFPQIRQIILQQPAMMEAILAQVQQTNPQLHTLIRDNAQEFMQILQNGLPAAGAPGVGGAPQGGAPPAGGVPGGPPGVPPGAQVIQLTPDEAAAVGRLQSLGFPRNAALEAYLACDKNEEAAANYLFDNGADWE